MTGRWRAARLRRQLRRSPLALQLVHRRLRAHLESAPGAALALVEIEATESATIAIASLARSLSSEGNRVVVADAARGRPLAALLGARTGAAGTVSPVAINGQPVDLFVAPEDPVQMTDKEVGEDADTILVLATVEPGFGADHIAAWATDAVVMVRAGAASATRIDGVGQQLRAAGVTIRSAILIGADQDDDSSGYPPAFSHPDDPTDQLFETLKAAGR